LSNEKEPNPSPLAGEEKTLFPLLILGGGRGRLTSFTATLSVAGGSAMKDDW